MRRSIIMGMMLSLAVFLPACSGGQNDQSGGKANSGSKTKLKSQQDKFSYAVGMDIGQSLQPFKGKLDPKQVLSGLQDSLNGKKTKLTQEQKKQVIQSYVKKMQAQQAKEQKAEAAQNAKQSKKFLAKNAKKDGVKTTEDGLQYQVLNEGSGPSPGQKDVVTVKYKGELPNGKVFDSSYKRGKPATFPVNNVIPGWSEALQLMHVGGKYRLVIPPDLAYGKQGAGNKIGPNQVLIFQVELVGIKKNDEGQKSGASAGGAAKGQGSGNAAEQGGNASNGESASDTGNGGNETAGGGQGDNGGNAKDASSSGDSQ